jgi:hypothetical protein
MQMIDIDNLLIRYKKKIAIVAGIIVFICSFVIDTPTWILSKLVNHYSSNHLELANTHGTFWKGSGMLVALGTKYNYSTPIIMLNWNITFGLKKIVNIDFSVGHTPIAEVYINSKGVNLDNLKLVLSITQVSQLLDVVHDFDLSGDMELSAKHLTLGTRNEGNFTAVLSGLASGIAPVNPLGSYKVDLNLANQGISVSTLKASILNLSGSGDVHGLNLSASVDASKKDRMAQFVVLMGVPQPDGTYRLKVF